MYEFYANIRVKNEKSNKCFSHLIGIYSNIPQTKGCMENLENCGAWCCRIQTPQFLYSEFLNIWSYISVHFSDAQICDLIERCMLNAVNTCPSKQCVFFDGDAKLCSIHKVRGYNCRIYAITPVEEFNKRYEKIKEEYSHIPFAVVRPQCELVSTCNLVEVTSEDIDNWWKKLVEIEHYLGIKKKFINDDQGGSYRSPHDHILLYLMPTNILNAVAGIRLYDDETKKIIAVKEIVASIRGFFSKLRNIYLQILIVLRL